MPHAVALAAAFALCSPCFASDGAAGIPGALNTGAALSLAPPETTKGEVADAHDEAGALGSSRAHACFECSDGKWHLSFEPSVWYAGATGRLYLPQTTPGAVKAFRTFVNDINADSPRATIFPEVNVSKGNWGFGVRGFDFSLDPQASTPGYNGTLGDITFGPNDRLRASLDFIAVDVEGRYRIWEKGLGEGGKYAVAIDGVFGARYYHMDWKIEQLTPISRVQEANESFFEPDFGVKARVDLYDTFTLDALMTFGYSPSKSHSARTIDIMVGFQWRPIENVGVQIGYRQLLFDLKTGDDASDFRFDGSLAGLYGGIVIRF